MRYPTVIAAVAAALAAGTVAAGPDSTSPETRAYLSLGFGGQEAARSQLHYGLRIDHDFRLRDAPAAPVFQLDFGPDGRATTLLNGVALRGPTFRLNQAEETVEETEPGFFEGIWDGITGFFGGLFGGDDEEAGEATAEEAYEEAPTETADAGDEGTFLGYNAADWALLAVGAGGIGYLAAEVADGKDSPDVAVGGGLFGSALAAAPLTLRDPRPIGADPEWLDAGTGQMGDLHPAD